MAKQPQEAKGKLRKALKRLNGRLAGYDQAKANDRNHRHLYHQPGSMKGKGK